MNKPQTPLLTVRYRYRIARLAGSHRSDRTSPSSARLGVARWICRHWRNRRARGRTRSVGGDGFGGDTRRLARRLLGPRSGCAGTHGLCGLCRSRTRCPKGGDDARVAQGWQPESPPPLAFDHAKIVADYLGWRRRDASNLRSC